MPRAAEQAAGEGCPSTVSVRISSLLPRSQLPPQPDGSLIEPVLVGMSEQLLELAPERELQFLRRLECPSHEHEGTRVCRDVFGIVQTAEHGTELGLDGRHGVVEAVALEP